MFNQKCFPQVNDAFKRLRKLIPYENRNKRLSKFKTLRIAINYIRNLQDLIRDEEEQHGAHPVAHAHNMTWSCDATRPEVHHNVMSEYNKCPQQQGSGPHDFEFASAPPMMHQFSANGSLYPQYPHSGFSASPASNAPGVVMETGCNRWTGPQVQQSPNENVYHSHM